MADPHEQVSADKFEISIGMFDLSRPLPKVDHQPEALTLTVQMPSHVDLNPGHEKPELGFVPARRLFEAGDEARLQPKLGLETVLSVAALKEEFSVVARAWGRCGGPANPGDEHHNDEN